MEQPVFMKVAALAEREAAAERSAKYLQDKFSQFLKKSERVLICFTKKDDTLCRILEQAVVECGAVPVWLGEDCRWVTILKTAFTSKCNCIVGSPLMLLGLSKVARHMGTPLFARNVLLSGYPSTEWMVKAIERGLDCQSWGCFDPGVGAVISGFSCGNRIGVHIRDDEYGVDIVDEQGNLLPEGETGRIVLYPKEAPELRLVTGQLATLDSSPCKCGCKSPRLLNLDNLKENYASLSQEGERLHYWSSILDCRLEKNEYGLELEVVVFQGEKLPKLPSCAKMVIRPWNPETDEPFDHYGVLKKKFISGFNH